MKFNKIASIFMLGLVIAAITSCSEPDDEIKNLSFNRNFAPLALEASNIKETTADVAWNTSAGATSYNLEVYADDSLTFNGTPEQVLTGIKPDEIPYSLQSLQFDTKYSVRVQAVTEGNDSRTSNWNGAYFKTSAKQFLKNPKPAQIADRSVILMWEVEEGFDVTTIVVGNITHEITAEEKEAGKATIEGLEPETTYTAYLYYNGKQCGNRNFTTIADLEGAILVHEGDDLKKVIEDEELPDGAVIAVYGGTYELNANESGQTGAAKVNKSIIIKGIYPTDQPTIKGRFEINNGASLFLSQLVIDGTNNATTDQILNYKTADVNYGPLNIQNCTITGQESCKGIIYLNVKSTVESITLNNCIVYGIECSGGDFIDSRTGYPKSITLSNSTFYNVAGNRDFIRIDDASSNFPGVAGPIVTIDHCTLYKVGGNETNYRLLYVRFAGNELVFTNNVIVGTNYKRGFTNQKTSDAEPTFDNNYYFDCKNLTFADASADATIQWYDTEGTVLSTSPFTGNAPNFTLNPDGAAFKGSAGDPRWLGAQ